MIELQGVQRQYAMSGQTVRALAGVDLHIGQGEFVAITGASGSGKSSLLNILGCLDRPSTGTYLFEGRDVATFDDEASSDLRNRRIGFVFQSFHLLPRLTVLENVMLPLRFHREPPPGTHERALALLDRVGLAERRDHRPSELSGGQKAKVLLLKMSLGNANVLILDEPTRNFSPLSGPVIRKMLREFPGAIISISHDRKYIGEVCGKEYLLEKDGLRLIREEK